jgi:hypothetical protein
MNKAEFISKISKETGLSEDAALRFINALIKVARAEVENTGTLFGLEVDLFVPKHSGEWDAQARGGQWTYGYKRPGLGRSDMLLAYDRLVTKRRLLLAPRRFAGRSPFHKWFFEVPAFDAQLQPAIRRNITPEYKAFLKKLPPIDHDHRLLLLQVLFAHGRDVFNTLKRFEYWLSCPHPLFQNRPPKEVLESDEGLGAIELELGRIEFGIF